MKLLSRDIYLIPDIDKTGIKQANKFGLKFLSVKIIRLPEKLKEFKDFRGNKCKDITDFLQHEDKLKLNFEIIKQNAVPLKFWFPIFDSEKKIKNYNINTVSFLNFLQAHGYTRINDETNEYGYSYARIIGNIVEKILPKSKNKGVAGIKAHVKDFINEYFSYKSSTLRNKMFKTKETDENVLSNLPLKTDLDFKTFDNDFMYLTFSDIAWKVTKDEIIESKINYIDKYIWKSDIKKECKYVRKAKVPIFEINYTPEFEKIVETNNRTKIDNFPDIDRYTIKINDPNFIFLTFLKNTSKIYWQKEKQGIALSEIEKKEESLHLINKIFSLGYLASRHKDPDKAWAVFAMDAVDNISGKSNGGTGKSLCYKSLIYINKTFDIQGRNPEKTKDRFIFDGVDEHTFTININDADKYLKFDFFFPYITDTLRVESKNTSAFNIPFSKSAKFIFSSNFALRNVDTSTKRRLLYTAFSDYYHEKDDENIYSETMSPGKEFGKKLFDDFTDEEWTKFYNFFALAIQTFMKIDVRIEPPMENIIKKNLKIEIGENYFDWFVEYFNDTKKLNTEIARKDMFDLLKSDVPQSTIFLTSQSFKKKLQAFCRYKNWIFNPAEALKNNTQIIRNSIEYFYISANK